MKKGTLQVRDGKLRVSARRGQLSQEDQRRLAVAKPVLMELMKLRRGIWEFRLVSDDDSD